MALMNLARGPGRPTPSSELREALAACWHAFIAIGLMSGLINILYLTGSFYMLEIYDRVLPSRSVPTLVALSILALTLFTFQGVLDVIRSRVMVRIAASLDERLSSRVYDIVVQLPLRSKTRRRRAGADSRSRSDPILSDRHRAARAVRSAVDADLHFHLLPVSSLDRRSGACRRDHPHQPDGVVGIHDAQTGAFVHAARRRSQRSCRGEPPQRRSHPRHGHGAAHGQGMGRRQQQVSHDAAADFGCGGRAWRDLESAAFRSSVVCARPRRLPRAPAAGDGGHHHRGLDHRGACARAGRTRGGQLARFRCRPAKLAPPLGSADRHGPGRDPDDAAAPEKQSRRGERDRNSAGSSAHCGAGCELHAQGGSGPRNHRAERVGQVLARAADCRRVGARARQGATRWCGARPMVAG